MWIGKDTLECDGKISDFSLIYNLRQAKIKSLAGKSISPRDILNLKFKRHIMDERYWF